MKRFTALALLLASGCAEAPSTAQWDDSASRDVRAAWDRSWRTIEAMDIATLAREVADDGFIGAFDLDPDSKPVSFATKDAAVKFMDGMFAEVKKGGGTIKAATRSFSCSATSNLAVCRAEVDFTITVGGQTISQPSRVTGAFRKGADGWKWIHWHSSLMSASK